MSRIFDNIEEKLLPALLTTLAASDRADFCVGYFNLRGWSALDTLIDRWTGTDKACCRLLVGMPTSPYEDIKLLHSFSQFQSQPQGTGAGAGAGVVTGMGMGRVGMDNQTALRLKKQMAEEFRLQLTVGAPNNADEASLRRLSAQLKAGKVTVKLHLRHKLHAKLYLLYNDSNTFSPITGFVGSSNLTFAGLAGQGELNVDVLDYDATHKLARWFEDRWNDRFCLDISAELAEIIDNSWAREELIPPYYIYLKMAYHLSQEARAGLSEFRIPRDFGNKLFEFQKAAVKIAAHHLNKRGGVLIGDVVGLGKTLMATAVARIFEDDYDWETLIICPKNLVGMWEAYKERYRLHARVLSISLVTKELPKLRRYRLLMIDESHNLRNRETKSYRAIQEYIRENESRVILLSATPYNKTYLDLSSQLRLFVPEDKDLGVRPEQLLRELGETEFIRRHQAGVRSLAAFEKSTYPDDWRELMRLYLIRRTRSFIQDNYAQLDGVSGRKFLTMEDGTRSYFPVRVPHTLKFRLDEHDPTDPYARLYSDEVVETLNNLSLPRYGLGNYILVNGSSSSSSRGRTGKGTSSGSTEGHTNNRNRNRPAITDAEKILLDNLGRAGQRLMGFCRTNLFKRLESGGPTFIQSIERHILRNFVFLHALDNGLALPLGTQDAGMLDLDTATVDFDFDVDDLGAMVSYQANNTADDSDDSGGGGGGGVVGNNNSNNNNNVGDDDGDSQVLGQETSHISASASVNANSSESENESDYRRRAAKIYAEYANGRYKRRFKWLRSSLFQPKLKTELLADSRALLKIRQQCGEWQADADTKLEELVKLLNGTHAHEKVLIFSQFADTVHYLVTQLKARGLAGGVAGVTGDSTDPTSLVRRFSPISNGVGVDGSSSSSSGGDATRHITSISISTSTSTSTSPNSGAGSGSSPKSELEREQSIRILVATDVLSEGQNLQDAAVIVNYDLPWAIIRLIQRAGRVDRIGQKAEQIHCYVFLPAEGVERIIGLRARVRLRLRENAEVVGTDEAFFDDEEAEEANQTSVGASDFAPNNTTAPSSRGSERSRERTAITNLYNEQAGILDGDGGNSDSTSASASASAEVDLASYAYQIWQNAIKADPTLQKIISDLPPVVFSTRALTKLETDLTLTSTLPTTVVASATSNMSVGVTPPEGVLVYMQTAEDNDALAWVDRTTGRSITESQLTILNMARCEPHTPALERLKEHHELVTKGVEQLFNEKLVGVGGQLGRPSGTRFRTYERLKVYLDTIKGTLWDTQALRKAVEEIHTYPLRQTATDILNRQLRSGISNQSLADLVVVLHDKAELCIITTEVPSREPQIICSLGLKRLI